MHAPAGRHAMLPSGVARLGADSTLLTGVSSDLLGHRLARITGPENVELKHLLRSAPPTALVGVGKV
jgi:sugar/nucleoside kinase (ribokinase family)